MFIALTRKNCNDSMWVNVSNICAITQTEKQDGSYIFCTDGGDPFVVSEGVEKIIKLINGVS